MSENVDYDFLTRGANYGDTKGHLIYLILMAIVKIGADIVSELRLIRKGGK